MATGSGTKDDPWVLKTPPGTSEYTMHVEDKDGAQVLVCTVGKTVLHYDARCVDDLLAMLQKHANFYIVTSGFARYRVPRITNSPDIEVELVGDDTAPSTGAGEAGIVPVAAAIANAVFDLTGERYRELPLQKYFAK